MEGRVIALDYGTRRVGIAMSDPLQMMASAAGVVERPSGTSRDQLHLLVGERLLKIIEEKSPVAKIILGLPKNMDGSLGPMADMVKELKEYLEEIIHIPLEFWDERLTSQQAEKEMIRVNVSRAKRKKRIDAMAAQFLLQNYLDSR